VKQIAGLHRLSAPELKERWRELFGTDPPGYNRSFLIKRLAYRLQELTHGGLSGDVQAKMKDILREAGLTEDGLTPGRGRLAKRSQDRPMEVLVSKCWVTETKETLWPSKISTSFAKSSKERVRRSSL
jgi:hypothetical protein